MGGENMVKRAKFGIHDVYRGVFLNRGVYIKAPPSFFQAYPSEFEAPPIGWQKLNIRVKEITHFDKDSGILGNPEPVVEIPAPEATPVAETVVTVDPAATPAMASGVEGDVIAPKRGRGRPRKAAL